MSTKTVLVVGCSGFVGSHVAQTLLEKGYHVRGTCRDTQNPEKSAWLKALAEGTPGELSLHELALTPKGPAPGALAPLMEGCLGVFMCAGYEKQDPSTIDFMVRRLCAHAACSVQGYRECPRGRHREPYEHFMECQEYSHMQGGMSMRMLGDGDVRWL